MKKFLMLVGALFVCHAMQAQYFCTTPNAELHYVNYDEAGQSTAEVTAKVQNVKRTTDGAVADYLCKQVTNKTKNNTSYSLVRWTYTGGKTICAEDLFYEMYIADGMDPDRYDETMRMQMMDAHKFKGDNSFFLMDDARAGEELPDRYYKLVDNVKKREISITGVTYMGEEKMSTTAGKFNCMKISYLKRTKQILKSENVRILEWYAKGIGLVKSEAYDMKGNPAGKTILVKVKK